MPEQQLSAAEASLRERQSKCSCVLDLLHQLRERFPWLPSSQDILRLWLPPLALCALTSTFDGKGKPPPQYCTLFMAGFSFKLGTACCSVNKMI